MKKLFITSAAAIICTISAANANITANESNPECDSATLGVDQGATKLEAQWNANNIDIKWYDGDTEITPTNSGAGTCTYDSTLTVPENELEKEGYTFNGWKKRAAAPVQVVYNSCEEIQNESDCASNGCGWNSQTSSCRYVACYYITSENICRHEDGCLWVDFDGDGYCQTEDDPVPH